MKIENSNSSLAIALLKALSEKGLQDYCVCPGARNAPLVALLREYSQKEASIQVFYFFDERAAAFFAIGRIRNTGRPVAVITTSGTAAGELLPATMEAHYSGVPLVLITADRPKQFRGTGAPQTAEQVGLFGVYVDGCMDLDGDHYLESLATFSKTTSFQTPFHVNVCFDEPLLDGQVSLTEIKDYQLTKKRPAEELMQQTEPRSENSIQSIQLINNFFKGIDCPIAIVSLLRPEEREGVVQLLLNLNIPAYFESISGLREDPRLQPIRLHDTNRLMERAIQAGYPIDGILRMGGVPTLRLWRDLEGKYSQLRVLSLSRTSYSGLSRSSTLMRGLLPKLCDDLNAFFGHSKRPLTECSLKFIEMDQQAESRVQELLIAEPQSEPGMVFALSRLICAEASRQKVLPRVYLGNSLPIREWDLAATRDFSGGEIWASRGLNGIDGQISTFFGYAKAGASNWALVGDLTALYDLQGPWVLPQLLETEINLVIMNNGGGKIFSKMFPYPEFQNKHQLRFSSFAELWNLNYSKLDLIPDQKLPDTTQSRLIELIPNEEATGRFWESYSRL
jgi:2-succinyl-5-enolpyruvyl-6-hydroxy-3-cyclohexene-1-carboxylate synthase